MFMKKNLLLFFPIITVASMLNSRVKLDVCFSCLTEGQEVRLSDLIYLEDSEDKELESDSLAIRVQVVEENEKQIQLKLKLFSKDQLSKVLISDSDTNLDWNKKTLLSFEKGNKVPLFFFNSTQVSKYSLAITAHKE